MSYTKFQSCIDACVYAAAMCDQCANSCLEEKEVEKLRTCIRLDLECAVICRTTAEVMMMDGQFIDSLCQLCAHICTACAEECRKHAKMGMEHGHFGR